MRRYRRGLAVLAVPFAVAMALALTAGSASAGTVPGVPSQSQMDHHHGFHLKKQTFQVLQVIKFRHHKQRIVVNNVDAQGPVDETGGTDTQVNNNFDIFDFGDGNTVNVLHTDVSNVQPGPTDEQSCTATATAIGRWFFDGGTGKYEKVFGFGKFKFTLLVQFKRDDWGKCKDGPKDEPKKVVICVSAWGKATLGHRKLDPMAA